MGNQHQRNSQLGIHLLEQGQHLASGSAVQVAGRLVGKKDGRLIGQSAGNGYPLLLPTGERAGQMVQAVANA